MSDLAYHQQLQQGLDSITRMARAINAKQGELSKKNEEVVNAEEMLKALREESEALNQQLILCHGQIQIGETMKKSLGENIQGLQEELRKLELSKAQAMNSATSAKNSAVYMGTIKEDTKSEMELYRELKAKELEAYQVAQKDLSKLKDELSQASEKLIATSSRIVKENETLEEQRLALDAERSGLITWQKKLTLYEKRLMNYAKQIAL